MWLLLDIDMPRMSGLQVARAVQEKNLFVATIILTIYKEEDMFNEAMDAGVRGYVLKETAVIDLLDAIKTVTMGEVLLQPFHFRLPRQPEQARQGTARPQTQRFRASPLGASHPEADRSEQDQQRDCRFAQHQLPDRRNPPHEHRHQTEPSRPKQPLEIRPGAQILTGLRFPLLVFPDTCPYVDILRVRLYGFPPRSALSLNVGGDLGQVGGPRVTLFISNDVRCGDSLSF